MLRKPLLTYLLDLQGHESIINVNLAAHFHHIGDVLVVQPEDLITAVVLVGVVQGDLDHVALLQLDLGCATLSHHWHKRCYF